MQNCARQDQSRYSGARPNKSQSSLHLGVFNDLSAVKKKLIKLFCIGLRAQYLKY
jgi:hypothetical protein